MTITRLRHETALLRRETANFTRANQEYPPHQPHTSNMSSSPTKSGKRNGKEKAKGPRSVHHYPLPLTNLLFPTLSQRLTRISPFILPLTWCSSTRVASKIRNAKLILPSWAIHDFLLRLNSHTNPSTDKNSDQISLISVHVDYLEQQPKYILSPMDLISTENLLTKALGKVSPQAPPKRQPSRRGIHSNPISPPP